MDLQNLKHTDPLDRSGQKQSDAPEFSPMSPPDAYAPPATEEIPYEEMPPFIQKLMDDHKSFKDELDLFEQALVSLRENGLPRESDGVDSAISRFFGYMDEFIIAHHTHEERILFPLLRDRLLETGEHGAGDTPTTAVDIMADDHGRGMQLAAVTFNFLGLCSRLPDARSRTMVLDAAIEQGQALIEHLRLHMFREDNVVFTMAAKHLTPDELARMAEALPKQ